MFFRRIWVRAQRFGLPLFAVLARGKFHSELRILTFSISLSRLSRIFQERLHPEDDGDVEIAPTTTTTTTTGETAKREDDDQDDREEPPWERIIGDCPVVTMEDRGLVADSQLAAIAQMKLSKLSEADQIGWFKHRKVRN